MSSRKTVLSSERVYTKNLIVERLKASDWKFFKNIAGDPLVYRYFEEYQRKGSSLKKFFLQEIVAEQSSYCMSLVIRKHDETPIGIINAYNVENGTWLMEYALLETYRKNGYMTEVLEYICIKSGQFLNVFGITASIKTILFEISNDNTQSAKLIKSVSEKHGLHCELSIRSFLKCFNSKSGWTWYKLDLQ